VRNCTLVGPAWSFISMGHRVLTTSRPLGFPSRGP
jgi:hypothetical protein